MATTGKILKLTSSVVFAASSVAMAVRDKNIHYYPQNIRHKCQNQKVPLLSVRWTTPKFLKKWSKERHPAIPQGEGMPFPGPNPSYYIRLRW